MLLGGQNFRLRIAGVAFHVSERTGDGHSLYSAHENLSCGACGAGSLLGDFSRPNPDLRTNSILAKKALANPSLHPGCGTLGDVPVYAGRVRGWQQIVIPVQGKKGAAR